jgi:hypothetical protein
MAPMKLRCRVLAVCIAGVVAGSASAGGQSRLPDTEFHDFIQRSFVVELARVLAWRQNRTQEKIVEIVYDVAIDRDRTTRWHVKWLDSKGKPIREASISYPENLLVQGPAFYRTVFDQMCGTDWPASGTNSVDSVVADFWKGAEFTGLSRAESLRAAFKLMGREPLPPEQQYAPQLAGLLTHTALHSFGYAVTLDGVVLARAAAWLCVSESLAGGGAGKTDSLWSPLLFLAGREQAAAALWKKSPIPSAMPNWWELMLSRPASRDVFLFATDPQRHRFAMPFLAYRARMELSDAQNLGRVIGPIFNDEQATLFRLHDYSAMVDRDTGIAGGRALEGLWPALARKAWVEMLSEFSPGTLDYRGYVDDLKRAQTELEKIWPPEPGEAWESDLSLIGFDAVSPLLEHGYAEGWGRLIPVATVTARDLLNFGWEMTGVQMGRRHMFVNEAWSVPERAAKIADTVLPQVSGMDAFFKLKSYKQAKRLLNNVDRLQGVDLLGYRLGLDFVHAASDQSAIGDRAELFYRRCWLRAAQIKHQCRTLWNSGAGDRLVGFADRVHAEGGTLCDADMLRTFLFTLKSADTELELQFAGKHETEERLGRALPHCPSLLMEIAAKRGRRENAGDFEVAQQLERLFWQRPGAYDYAAVFRAYVRAHAYDAAKRFYAQCESVVDDRVGFSNAMGPQRFTLAMMEGDVAGMRAAQRASATGSGAEMIMNIVACAVRDDIAAMQAQLDAMSQRYDREGDEDFKESMAARQKLRDFIPLIPALRDATHADRQKALDFFAKDKYWPTLQWVLTRNCRLGAADAVRFLGGRETDPERRLMVCYLLKDKPGFAIAYGEADAGKWQTMAFVVAHYLRNELLAVPVPAEQPDLMPPGAQSITQAVLDALRKDRLAKPVPAV